MFFQVSMNSKLKSFVENNFAPNIKTYDLVVYISKYVGIRDINFSIIERIINENVI